MTNHTQLSKRFFMAKLPRRFELAKMRKPVKMTTPIQLSKPLRIAKLPWRAELAKCPKHTAKMIIPPKCPNHWMTNDRKGLNYMVKWPIQPNCLNVPNDQTAIRVKTGQSAQISENDQSISHAQNHSEWLLKLPRGRKRPKCPNRWNG